MSASETISLLRAHCDANDKRERATFSIASIRELLAFVDDCAATIRPFPPLPSREIGGKASMSRELLGAVVDDVFDGAIEDPSVIEDIYASIKRHEGALSTDAEPVGEPLELPYKNWRGEISTRKLQPIRLEFGATEWHPEPQWLLVATDIEKNIERSFALKDFNPQQTVPAVALQDVAGWRHEEKLTSEEAWTILCETSDITSPEEYPNHALITFEQLQSYMERAIVADQWQIVPKEPTQEMLECGADSCCSLTVHGAHGVYRSMLSASLSSKGGDAP